MSQQLSNIYSEDGSNSIASPPPLPQQCLSQLWESGSIGTQEKEEYEENRQWDDESIEEERAMLSRMSTISESDYDLESHDEDEEEEDEEEEYR